MGVPMGITNKTILAFGGAGFIGSRVCEWYSKKEFGNEVYAFDNLERDALKYTDLGNRPNFDLIVGDITAPTPVAEVIDELSPDIIYNFAAVAGVENVLNRPWRTMHVNMIGTYNILRGLLLGDKYGPPPSMIDRFVFFSTSEVFGKYSYKSTEKHPSSLLPAGEGRWIYSVSKIASEHLIDSFSRECGLSYTIIRPFNIYGPGQIGEGAVHTFITRALKDLPIQIRGDGDQIRSWCYIDDMVEGIKLCTEKSEAVGNTFNIGNPRGTITVNMLARLIKRCCGSSSKIEYVPMDYEDVELRIPSIEKARTVLGYSPQMGIEQGLSRTIDWYLDVGV
jgi:dTDP-glucose 4,6-dehydratase